jgi:hypothetical protein
LRAYRLSVNGRMNSEEWTDLVWAEAVVTYLRYSPKVCLDVMTKPITGLRTEIWTKHRLNTKQCATRWPRCETLWGRSEYTAMLCTSGLERAYKRHLPNFVVYWVAPSPSCLGGLGFASRQETGYPTSGPPLLSSGPPASVGIVNKTVSSRYYSAHFPVHFDLMIRWFEALQAELLVAS